MTEDDEKTGHAAEECPCTMSPDRRKFFTRLSIMMGSLIGVLVTIPCMGFVLAPIVRRPPRLWREVAKLDDLAVGETKLVTFEDASSLPWAGVTARTASWLRREGETEFIAFSINCRHLGCPVRWVDGAELFMCPCHGGVYYKDGSVAAGPPPKALARYPVRVRDGVVEIETSPVPLTD
jgi:menaquinol-cytochrome c reductase iron-sulfur subunit